MLTFSRPANVQPPILLAKIFNFANLESPSWFTITKTNKFLLFIGLVLIELIIHLVWYATVLLASAPVDYFELAPILNQVINRPLMLDMAWLTLAMLLFCGFSLWFITLLSEKSNAWLYYQGFFVMVYLSYAIIFSFCIGENTSVIGIMLLSGTGFGLLLLKWRFIVIAFIVSMLTFVICVLNRHTPWMQAMPNFYPYFTARSHWVWGLSYSWLVFAKAAITLWTVAQVLKLFSLQRKQIYELLEVDALTAIANRRSVCCYLNYLWKHKSDWSNLSLIYFDLDKFKQINDEHGHDAGDATLKATACLMRALLPNQTLFGRMGGEEFCVVLPNIDMAAAVQIAEQLRNEFAKQTVKFGMDEHEIHFTASFGIASVHQPQANPLPQPLNFDDFIDEMRNDMQTMPSLPPVIEQLLKFADLAMQQAKANGRNCVITGNRYVLFVDNQPITSAN